MKKSNKEKQELILWAERLHQKSLLSAGSGNISYRIEENRLYITAHESYLGFLKEEEILLVDLEGNIVEGTGAITSEKDLHLSVQKSFPDMPVVLHAHSPFTVAYFNRFTDIEYGSFESKFYLGKVPVLPQATPTVTEVGPVLEALQNNRIAVLKNHGVIAIEKEFKSAFSLIELLEQQCYVNLVSGNRSSALLEQASTPAAQKSAGNAFELFSEAHVRHLTGLVNDDTQARELGKKYNLTTSLAIKNTSSGVIHCFHYRSGKIEKIDQNDRPEFLISADEKIWKKIFNREIDPFVASTQGIIKLKGDFNKMSAWFPVFERTFKLWEQAPVI